MKTLRAGMTIWQWEDSQKIRTIKNGQVFYPVEDYLAISNPRIKLSSILWLSWIKEVANGSNFISCVVTFLKSISRSLSSVFMEDEDVVLCMKSPALLRKALFDHVSNEGLEQGLENLTPRMRMVPDYLSHDYKLDIFFDEHNINLFQEYRPNLVGEYDKFMMTAY